MKQTDFSRRGFFGKAAAFAAPAILRAQGAGDKIRVAYVGVGNRGGALLRNGVRVKNFQVVAVCDIIPERAQAAAKVVADAGGSARVWTDFRKMLDEQKDIDAVVLATPDWTHKDIDLAILEVGKHLYAEKPLATTPDDCRMVVTAARQSRKIMQVGFQLRHDPRRRAAEDFIHKGGIGRVLMCHGIRHGSDLPRNIPWYFDRTKTGDIIVDQGIHILDLFTWAIGSHPLRVMGSGGTNLFVNDPPGRTVMDNYNLILDYPNDVRVNFSHHYFDPPGFSGDQERVFGTEGSIDLVTATWMPRMKRQTIKLEVEQEQEDSTYMALDAFSKSVLENKTPVNNVDSALVSTLLPIMATRSIVEKRIVKWE